MTCQLSFQSPNSLLRCRHSLLPDKWPFCLAIWTLPLDQGGNAFFQYFILVWLTVSQLAALWYRLTDLTFPLMGHGGCIHLSVMPLFCNYHTFAGRTSTHLSAFTASITDAQNEDTMALTWQDKLDPIHQKVLENLVQGLPLYMD